MRLVSVQRARALWLFPLADINPTGKYILPVLAAIVKRYSFANVPNLAEALQKQEGAIFGQGCFTFESEQVGVELALYNDGIIGDTTSSTDASDAFLEDLLEWVVTEHGLNRPSLVRRAYASEIYVECDHTLASLTPGLDAFGIRLNQVLNQYRNAAYTLTGIAFTAQQTSAIQNPPFRFEKAEGLPAPHNRYYGAAPVKTHEHVELLRDLEVALAEIYR